MEAFVSKTSFKNIILILLSELTLVICSSTSKITLTISVDQTEDLLFRFNPPQKKTYTSTSEIVNANTVILEWDYSVAFSDCSYMFADLTELINIDLSEFNSNNIINMNCMFCNCTSLTYVNFGKFNASLVENMEKMFYNCEQLTSVNFDEIYNTSSLINMHMMFGNCKKLIFINMSSFYNNNYINGSYLFYNCNELTYINFSEYNVLHFNSMEYMFGYCNKLLYLNLLNFDTSKVIDMTSTFRECRSLRAIENINFNNSLVESMTSMFSNCVDLTSLDLSNFTSSKYQINMNYMFQLCQKLQYIKFPQNEIIYANSMTKMFKSCQALTSLDLSCFNTSQVKDFDYLFQDCRGLEYINLKNFETSSVETMNGMFSNCNSLTSLDLSSFVIPRKSIQYIFENCKKLEYLNIYNFPSGSLNVNSLSNTPNFNYCLKGEVYIDKLASKTRDCSDKCFPENRIYDKTSKLCIKCPKRTKLSNDGKCEELSCNKYYNYEQTDCIEEIELGYYLNDTVLKTIDKCNEECKSCNNESVSMNSCIKCNDNFYPILNNASNINPYIKCYQKPEGYYLDINDSYFKPCYYSCKSCNKEGNDNNHNCLTCNEDYIYEMWYYDNYTNNYKNCYKECDYYHYFDKNENKLFCTETLKCPLNYSKLIVEKNECVSDCRDNSSYQYEFDNKCYPKCPKNTKLSNQNTNYCELSCTKETPFELIEEKNCVANCPIYSLLNKKCKFYYINDLESIDIFFNNIQNDLTSNNFNLTNLKNGEEILLELNENKFIITKGNKNITKLEECESILRDEYNINNKDLIYKIIVINPNVEENNIKYEMYYPLNNNNLIKLNSNLCEYKCEEPKCLKCSEKSLSMNLCISCNKNYYPIIDDASNIYPYINCYQNPEGYYLDSNDLYYKPSYTNCSKYFYYDNKTNKSYCTKELSCPKDIFNKLIIEKKQCIEECYKDDTYKYEYNKCCYKECPLNTENKDYYCYFKCPKDYPFENVEIQQCVSNCSIIEFQNKICTLNYLSQEIFYDTVDKEINNVIEELTNGFDTSILDKGENFIIQEKGLTLTITTTDNQKNIENNKNITTINLGECETKLKNHYKIPQNNSLYILKLDVSQEGMKIPKIEYEVYYPLKGKNLTKLNLTVCEDTKVDISIPVLLTENMEKHNPSSAYYNDICYPSTSKEGADIPLADRKKEFIEQNKTLCEDGCEFIKYNYDTRKAICSCNVKMNLPSISDVKIDKNKLYESFTDSKNIANKNIMNCYKAAFSSEGFKKNYGPYISMSVIAFNIITAIIYFLKQENFIKKKIMDIIQAKNAMRLNKGKIKEDEKISEKKDNKDKEMNDSSNRINAPNENENRIKNDINNKGRNKKRKVRKKSKYIDIKNFPPIKKIKKKKKKFLINNNNNINNNQNYGININLITNHQPNIINNIIPSDNLNNNQIPVLKQENNENFENLVRLNENELNSLLYEEALKIDKRTYFKIYCSLLKSNHLSLLAFSPSNNDYDSRLIKIDLLFISFIISLTVNALFFNNNIIHKIYEDCGQFNFIYHIPQIIYSSIISGLIGFILKLLALTEYIVLEIKHERNGKEYNDIKNRAFLFIRIKLMFFFIFSFILLLMCFYYLACFGGIYKNTQIHLIKDTLISFSLTMVYPFLVCLIPGTLRFYSLKKNSKAGEYMYKFSKIIQLL